ncbi:MAG: hypothetical protein V4568_17540 [Pseudomonadota bacterium]
MVKRYIFVLAMLVLCGCSNNPNDIKLGAAPSEDIEKNADKLKKLSPEDMALLRSYVTAAATSELKGRPNPAVNKTVGEVLRDARTWKSAQQSAAAEQLEKQESEKMDAARVEAERKLLQERVAATVVVSLIKRVILPPNPDAKRAESIIRMEYDVENRGGKAILALKGKAVYRDLFGNTIVEHPFQIDKTIPIGGHVEVPINYRVSPVWREMMSLANAEEGKYTFSFSPEALSLEGEETLSLTPKTGK